MTIFKHARLRLTLYYSLIIVCISVFFSLIIYNGAKREMVRIENMQRLRRPNVERIIDIDIVNESKYRMMWALLNLNLGILGLSAIAGYFLAGRTLEPIAKMMESQKDFIANASHELRTPLTTLKTEIEVGLRDKNLNLAKSKKILLSNLEDVNKMTNLSNYLLILNRFQNKKINFESVNLNQIALKAAENKNVEVNGASLFVKGDYNALFELISILIDNALKYSDNKLVEVDIKNKTLLVKDRGVGISETDLPHIFDRFYRADKSRSKEGYGLGLSIAKQIADLHNAQIVVESKLNKGSVFKVIFS